MSIEFISIIMLLAILVTLALGLPLAFTLGGIAVIFTSFLWGPKGLLIIASTAVSLASIDVLLAVPLFIFMGSMLQESGIADSLYDMMYRNFGPLRGGLAIGTVIICTVFAAMAGLSAVATITMGLIALPSMLKRGYDKHMAIGCIAGGGALGILIPPSVTMVLYAVLARVSVGKLFAGGFLPGFVLSGLFIAYIVIKCALNPNAGPPIPVNERTSFKEKLVSMKAIIWPLILILLVLGSIYSGACTPTEAAGVGALGTVVAVIFERQFSFKKLLDALYSTSRVTAMVMWIAIGSTCFSAIYNAAGSQDLVTHAIASLPGGRWAVYILFHFIYFILGCLLDPTGIIMICTPIFAPIIAKLGFDPVWFGVTFVINMEMAYLTPPFGFNLFYMKSIVPEGITMLDIYRSVVPFIALQMLCLIIVSIFPQLVLWLPSVIM